MARLARSGTFDDYVVYENGPEWSFAGGSLAVLRLSRDASELSVASHTRRLPRAASLSDTIEPLLAEVPVTGWRTYGWAAFELAAPTSDQDLLHLVVPEAEVRVTAGSALLRAVDRHQLAHLADLLYRPGDEEEAPTPTGTIQLPVEDRGNYRDAVAKAVRAIGDGTLDKAIISRTVPVPGPVDLTATYVAGRRANTPARSFLLDLGRMRAAGFSPETIVEVTADGRVTSQPLAGTRARTGHPPTDDQLRAELLADPKEVYEHAISVRLACEELAKVCDRVHVEDFMAVRDRGSVQHLASTVRGRLRTGHGPWAAFDATFPAITATGIPKAGAHNLIRALEEGERDLYAGAVITFDQRGTLDAALVLRSIFQRDGHTWLQAGAGIVRQSHPEREHEETCEKLRSVAAHLTRPQAPP